MQLLARKKILGGPGHSLLPSFIRLINIKIYGPPPSPHCAKDKEIYLKLPPPLCHIHTGLPGPRAMLTQNK